MNNFKFSVFVYVFIASVFAHLSGFGQDSQCPTPKIQREIEIARKIYETNGYKQISSGAKNFFSANEDREFVTLQANKSYIFVFKTEKLIDQTSLSLLNSYNNVVQSVFAETGAERNSIVMDYKPNFSGEYTMVLKTVDYTGRSVCGSWLVLEK